MKRFGFLAGLAIACLAAGFTEADDAVNKRIALVIGNADYGAEIGKLDNPINDVELVGDSLRKVGFDVTIVEDADQNDMKRAIADFGKRLVSAGKDTTALFYYAGHGIQVRGNNYLIPVHAKIESEQDVDIEAVAAETVLRQMDFADSQLNIVVLDACRNNPLARSARSTSRGLARIDAPTGSFIAYSTAPGAVALDGTSRNSPFAKAFAEEMLEPGSEISETFRKVRTSVMASTNNEQVPWDSSSVTAPFYFVPPQQVAAATPAPEPAQPSGVASQTEIAFWDSVKDSPRASDYQLYLDQYPNGVFVKLAHSRLEALGGGSEASRGAGTVPAAQSAVAPAVQTASAGPTIADLDVIMFASKIGNLRQQPKTSAPVMKQLAVGDELQVTGKVDGTDWYRVSFDGNQTGYVHGSVVSADKPAAPQPTPAQPAPAQPVQQAAVTPAPAVAAPTPSPAAPSPAAPAPTAPAAPAVQAQPPAPIEVTDLNQVMYVVKKAKIRAAPNATAKIVKQLPTGSEIQVTGQVVGGDWYRIALANAQPAYVHASLLTSKKPQPKEDAALVAPAVAPDDQAAWDAVKNSTAKADFESYLAKFPAGAFAPQAKTQIAALDATATAAAGAAAAAPQSPLADGTIVLSPAAAKQVQDYLGDNRVVSGRKRAYLFASVDGQTVGSFVCPDLCADHKGGSYTADVPSMTYDDVKRKAQKACQASAKTECVLLFLNTNEKRSYQSSAQ